MTLCMRRPFATVKPSPVPCKFMTLALILERRLLALSVTSLRWNWTVRRLVRSVRLMPVPR